MKHMLSLNKNLPIFLLNKDFLIKYISESIGNITEVEIEKILGRSLFEFTDSSSISSIKLPHEINLNFSKPDNHISNISGVIFQLGKSHALEGFSYIVLISPQKNELGSSSREIQTSKLEALGTLAGGIAHDLNNMLMAVLGHLSYLRLSQVVSSDNESLQSAEEGAKLAAKLAQQILDFSRRHQASPDVIDIGKAIAATIPLISPSLPEDIEVSLRSSSKPLNVQVDESQITQIVLNLLVNARDAISGGGKILLEIDSISYDKNTTINGFQISKGDFARIQISDNGQGITEEVKDKIFEPFFTTKRGTGTGLGLATVFYLVKSLRGAIYLNSEIEVGTTFSVLLPLSDFEIKPEPKIDLDLTENINSAANIRTEDQSSTHEAHQINNSFKVLVVDDEDPVRMVIQRSLELLGYDVLVAESGKTAIDIFKNSDSTISLVIMDMIMPVMPGHELFYELKKIDPGVKILISSGYAADGKTQELLNNGAKGFIQKPFAIEELAEEVKRCVT